MLDKSYDKSIRESAAKGMEDGIMLERNVRSGNIIIIDLDEAHKRLAIKYSDLFKLKKGDDEILALCHQISAKGIVSEDDDFHSKKVEIQIALGNDFNLKARYEHSDSSIVARQLLAKGIEEDRKNFAAKIFKERKVSLREAAEIAGISTTEMIEILKERGIKLDYSLESLRREIKEVYKELGLDVSCE